MRTDPVRGAATGPRIPSNAARVDWLASVQLRARYRALTPDGSIIFRLGKRRSPVLVGPGFWGKALAMTYSCMA